MIGLLALLAAAPALPFAPPIDTPLRYETVDRRAADGAAPEQRFTLVQEARFTRDGAGGYLLSLRMLSAHADAPGRVAAIFDAAMQPSVGGVVTIRVSPAGEPGVMTNAEVAWTHVVDALDAMAVAARDAPPDRRATIEAVVAATRATPPAAPEARLRGGADAILGVTLPPLGIGETAPLSQSLASPAGPVAATGTVRRDADGPGTRLYHVETAGEATPPTGQGAYAPTLHLLSEEDVTLSASSGLMLADTHRVTIAIAGGDTAPIVASDTSTRLLP